MREDRGDVGMGGGRERRVDRWGKGPWTNNRKSGVQASSRGLRCGFNEMRQEYKPQTSDMEDTGTLLGNWQLMHPPSTHPSLTTLHLEGSSQDLAVGRYLEQNPHAEMKQQSTSR